MTINVLVARPLYQRLMEMSGCDGSIFLPENQLTEASVVTLFQKLADEMYTPFKGTLKCGNLESRIILSPSPVVRI